MSDLMTIEEASRPFGLLPGLEQWASQYTLHARETALAVMQGRSRDEVEEQLSFLQRCGQADALAVRKFLAPYFEEHNSDGRYDRLLEQAMPAART